MWRIAAPMILSNVSVPLLGMVDTGVMGHLDSPAYLGAVAIGGTIFTFLYIGMNFLRMGTTGIAAQRFGAEDYDGLRVSLGQALIVSLGIAVFILLLQNPLGKSALMLLGGDAVTQSHAATYFYIRVWSAPGTLANYVLIGWFLGLQNARVPLFIFLTINVTNIVLDLLFVVGFGMKIEGVALASVIAEYTALGVAIGFAARELRRHSGHWPLAKFTKLSAYRAFFSVNANLFVRTMALMFTFAFVTAVRLTLKWSLIFAAGFVAVYLFAGPLIVRLLTNLPDVRETAMVYLPWLIASPLISVWCFLYDGVYVGMTRARDMRNIMLFSAFAIFIPTWFLTQPLGNHGLWLALMAFLASRGIGMHIGYRRALAA